MAGLIYLSCDLTAVTTLLKRLPLFQSVYHSFRAVTTLLERLPLLNLKFPTKPSINRPYTLCPTKSYTLLNSILLQLNPTHSTLFNPSPTKPYTAQFNPPPTDPIYSAQFNPITSAQLNPPSTRLAEFHPTQLVLEPLLYEGGSVSRGTGQGKLLED